MGDELTVIFMVVAVLWSAVGVGLALLLTRRSPPVLRVIAVFVALAMASLATTMTLFLF